MANMTYSELLMAFQDLTARYAQVKKAYPLSPEITELIENNLNSWQKTLAVNVVWDAATIAAWNSVYQTTSDTVTRALGGTPTTPAATVIAKARPSFMQKYGLLLGFGMLGAAVYFTRRRKHWLESMGR